MSRRQLVLISRWRLAASRERVWALLADPEAWPRWWPHLAAVRCLAAGDDDGNGALREFNWRSGVGYRIAFVVRTVRVRRLQEIEGVVHGDVRGRGLWLVEEGAAGEVCLTYRWSVDLERRWMRLLAPLLQPLFAWRHFVVMRAGARGMAAFLGCALGAMEEWSALAPSHRASTPA